MTTALPDKNKAAISATKEHDIDKSYNGQVDKPDTRRDGFTRPTDRDNKARGQLQAPI